MNIEDYPKIYQIAIGTRVIIKESQSMPQVVGKIGKVCGWVDPETFGSPLMLMLDEPVYFHVAPGVPFAMAFQGPLYCRPNELTIIGDVPDIFSKAFDENPKKEGGDTTAGRGIDVPDN